MMTALTKTLATHTATGSGTGDAIGDQTTPGRFTAIGSPIRIIRVSGTFVATLKIEGSLDGTDWFDWITSITAPSGFIIDSGPIYLRSTCSAYTSGTATVKIQKFILQ